MKMPKDLLADLADPILTMMNVRVGHRVSLTQQVENRLKCALILGLMKPGDRVITKEVATELKMSITPVREALVRLSSQEALSSSPSHAFTVPEVPKERLLEYMSLRKILEAEVLRKSFENLTESKIGEFMQVSDELRVAHRLGNAYDSVKLHLAMRLKLYSFAEAPELNKLIIQLWINVGPSFHFLYNQTALLSQWPGYYDDLDEALRVRDVDKAIASINYSIDRGTSIYLKALSL